MLVFIISRSSSKLGYFGSKTRSQGQIIVIPCVHFRRHSFDPKFTKLSQNVNLYDISVKFKLGHIASKYRPLGQITKIRFKVHETLLEC